MSVAEDYICFTEMAEMNGRGWPVDCFCDFAHGIETNSVWRFAERIFDQIMIEVALEKGGVCKHNGFGCSAYLSSFHT